MPPAASSMTPSVARSSTRPVTSNGNRIRLTETFATPIAAYFQPKSSPRRRPTVSAIQIGDTKARADNEMPVPALRSERLPSEKTALSRVSPPKAAPKPMPTPKMESRSARCGRGTLRVRWLRRGSDPQRQHRDQRRRRRRVRGDEVAPEVARLRTLPPPLGRPARCSAAPSACRRSEGTSPWPARTPCRRRLAQQAAKWRSSVRGRKASTTWRAVIGSRPNQRLPGRRGGDYELRRRSSC